MRVFPIHADTAELIALIMMPEAGSWGKCAGYARMTGGTKESDWDKCSRVTALRFRHIAQRKAVQRNQLKKHHCQSED